MYQSPFMYSRKGISVAVFSSQPDAVGFDQEPLLVFVNGKSGGNQGVKLISGFVVTLTLTRCTTS